METTKIKMPKAKRLVRRVQIVDRLPGTTREAIQCPICQKAMTLDSPPHYHH